jgi:alanine racemase
MLGRFRNTFAEVDLTALEENFVYLQGLAKNIAMAPMVKADAYGHGDVQVSRVCEKLGARFLGVALIEEGIKLRLAGIQVPILVFCQFDSIGAEAMVKFRLTPILSTFDQINKLKSVVNETASYPVHVKFNTGMERLGFEPSEATQVATELRRESFLKMEGVCTHFASSDDFAHEKSATKEQINLFQKIMGEIKAQGRDPILFHYLNSGGILGGVEPRLDLARPGISIYGVLPVRMNLKVELKPVMSVKSFVAFIHKVKKGGKVSYGGTWQAPKNSVIAVISIGYADGIPRQVSNKGQVIIRGEICPMVGTICMDSLMVDVTNLAEKNQGPMIGDEVVLIGSQHDKVISARDLADAAQMSPYEILTGMQGRLPRIYIH